MIFKTLNEANMNSDELKRLRQIKEGLKYLETTR